MTDDLPALAPTTRRLLLPTVALVSLAGVIGLSCAAWFATPEEVSLISGVVVFLENLVVAIVGFYTGQSMPEVGEPRP